MGKETSDFRYNTGDTKVPWAAVGENYNAADTFEFVKFLMQGKGPAYGARPVKRAIQRDLENPIAKLIVGGKFLPGATIKVTAKDGKIVI